MSGRKRKHVVCTLQQKLDILDQLDKGVKGALLAKEYGIGSSTIADIKKKREKLYDYVKSTHNSLFGTHQRCTMRKSPYDILNRALLHWFNVERSQDRDVSGPMLIEKAKELHETLGLKGSFDGTSGWLSKFKERYGIRKIGSSLDCVWTNPTTWQEVENNNVGSCEEDTGPWGPTDGQTDSVLSIKEFENQNIKTSADGSALPIHTVIVKDNECETIDEKEEENQDNTSEEIPSASENSNDESYFYGFDGVGANTPGTSKPAKIKINDENICECAQLKHIINKLETVSDKLIGSSVCDSYEQFGKYISSLLRQLPLEKAYTLKQKLVSDVLDVLLDYERAPQDNTFSSDSRSKTKIEQKDFSEIFSSNFKIPVHGSSKIVVESCDPSIKSWSGKSSKDNTDSKKNENTLTSRNCTRRNILTRASFHKTFVSEAPEDVLIRQEQPSSNPSTSPRKSHVKKVGLQQTKLTSYSAGSRSPTTSINGCDKEIEEELNSNSVSNVVEADACDNALSKVKQEPMDEESVCELCSVICASNQILTLHFRNSHPGCVPSVKYPLESELSS